MCNPHFIAFLLLMNVNIYVIDQCLSCFLLSAVVSSVLSSFVLSHSCLSPLATPSCTQNSNHKHPQAVGFLVERASLPSEFQKVTVQVVVTVYRTKGACSFMTGFLLHHYPVQIGSKVISE